MPSLYLTPRRVSVELFEYGNTVFVSYLVFILFLVALYKYRKTKNNNWKKSAIILAIAALALIITNWVIWNQTSLIN